MERIALIYGGVFLYWNTILLTLAAAAAICLFLSLYIQRSENLRAACLTVPIALVLSLILARLVHWYCRADSYDSLLVAMTNYFSGGYALMGVFAGCALAAVILRLTGISRNLPEMLDCMSLAGAVGIAVGRLSSFFDSSDRGEILERVTGLPWAYPVENAVSGVLEYRLATFLFQSVITACIASGLLIFWFRDKKHRSGDVTVLFLLCYGASQVVLDSTRYDSLFFRSNGFVSIVQVLGAVAIGCSAIYLSVRMVKKGGFRKWYLALWAGIAALMGIAGYMEYHVQRHGDQAAFAYSVMSGALVILTGLILWIYCRSRQAAPKAEAK